MMYSDCFGGNETGEEGEEGEEVCAELVYQSMSGLSVLYIYSSVNRNIQFNSRQSHHHQS